MGTSGGPSRLRRLAARVGYTAASQLLYWVAVGWRRVLRRTTVVAVTGTHGKTTTKELVAAILAAAGPTLKSAGNENTGLPLVRNVLRLRPRHRYAVFEVGIGGPGEMARLARLVQPDVAIVLAVLRAHTPAFGDRERQAREKALLLRRLRSGGLAVLNADDPHVAAMAAAVRGTVVQVGSSPAVEVRAAGVAARWPERLELDVLTRDGESRHVRTRLVGAHWATSVVAALATARGLGITLEAAAATLAATEPFPGRMQPCRLPSGAVVLRDDYDGSIEAFDAAVKVLAEARAARRIAVIADVSDFGNTRRRKRLAELGRRVAAAAELAVFVGEGAGDARGGALAAGLAAANARAFEDLPLASAFLRDTLREGDLVLLKGRVSDHLARLFFSLLGPVGCWRTDCEKILICDECPALGAAASDRARASPAPVCEPDPAGASRAAPRSAS